MLNIAMLSKWHVHAEGYANQLLGTGKCNITAVWDNDEARGKPWADKLGAAFSTDLDAILARADVDAVIVDAPTSQHEYVMVKAANAKKHIFTEKAMAPTVAECERIKEAVLANDVTFMISLPQRCTPVVRFAKQLIADGAFGKISLVRIRNGHDGVSGGWLPAYWFEKADACGGSLMDLGCHPMYTASWLLGKPISITSIMTTPFGGKVDEAATASILFENDAVATCETSFVTYRTPCAVEIYGSDATLIEFGGQVQFCSKALKPYINDCVTPTMPAALPIPILQFPDVVLDGIKNPEGFGLDDGIELTRLLQGAYLALDNGGAYKF